MRIIELFAGIGACSKALKNIGIDLEIVDAVEIDKYAISSFNAIHETNFETQDITKWNKDFKDIDLITHGSPCQDFSIAGKQAGGDIGSGTRSSLMYETIRIVNKIKPKYVLWENVKNILSKKHKHNFENYIETMKILGYNSYYQILNSKNYGVPQNRERVYTISIRTDIDKSNFKFPEKEELRLRLKDMLEDKVEDKYYLNDAKVEKISNSNFMQEKNTTKSCCNTILARDYKDSKCIQTKIIYEKPLERKGWHHKACEILNTNGITTCIHTQSNNLLQKIKENETCRIRKLTPKECWRLMGFSDKDFEKASNIPTSNTQLYKQAGNSIVVNVLEKIFQNLFKEDKKMNKEKNLYTIGNEDNLEKALEGLGQFCHNWCMNCKETAEKNDLVFRCEGCDFKKENGDCQIKIFLHNYTSGNIGKYTSMGDL